MSLRMQAALLRFLETGELQRVGADRRARPRQRSRARRHEPRLRGAHRVGRVSAGPVLPAQCHQPAHGRRSGSGAKTSRTCSSTSSSGAARSTGLPRRRCTPEALEIADGLRLAGQRPPVEERRRADGAEASRARNRHPGTCPIEILPCHVLAGRPPGRPRADARRGRPQRSPAAEMIDGGQSFWTVVYPLFMERDLCRSTLRKSSRSASNRPSGSYQVLVQLFNMPRRTTSGSWASCASTTACCGSTSFASTRCEGRER